MRINLFTSSMFILGLLSTPAVAADTVALSKPVYSQTLHGSGPNGTKDFEVIYTSTLTTWREEYTKGWPDGSRHCRWSYPEYRLNRDLYSIIKPAGGAAEQKDLVASGLWTQTPPGPDDTNDNCNNIYNNVLTPTASRLNVQTAWQAKIDSDKLAIDCYLGKPASQCNTTTKAKGGSHFRPKSKDDAMVPFTRY